MQGLKNPFPDRVRLLYLGCWECWKCKGNGQDCGGLEIHHIMGRISGCAFNSSCLCKKCHTNILHTQEEESKLFLTTVKFLWDQQYDPTDEDIAFYEKNDKRLWSPELVKWLGDKNRR